MPEPKYESARLELERLLSICAKREASDLHISCGKPPLLRIEGKLAPIEKEEILTPEKTESLVLALMNEAQKEKYLLEKELDFSLAFGEQARFRVNVYHEKGHKAASLRLIPLQIKTLKELGLPETLKEFCEAKQGFVLVVGPAGHGKSTTLACMIDIINHTHAEHIITIEDPIEYLFTEDKCLLDQREVYADTNSFSRALRSVLRQDPNVVMIGEMRDLETISSALTVAETGHLVFSTLHTNNAPQTIDRIVDVFPPYQQRQIRVQLANNLLGIVSQRLITRIGGGRVVVVEVMKNIPAVASLIREGKTYQLDSIIQTSAEEGMIPLDKSLAELYKAGEIRYEDALAYANNKKGFKMMMEEAI